MTARVLPVEEWPRLDGTLLASIWRTLDPRFAEVLVVERDGEVVGTAALLTTLHAECVETHGDAAVGRALWTTLRARVAAAGGRAVWGAATEAPMARLLARHAEPIPGEHFLVRM